MRLGLFGGRFDPPHLGHLLIAQGALEELRLDRLLFLPSPTPPHKSALAGAEARYEMTVLATAGHPNFFASRLELGRPGPSYTFDTVAEVRRTHPKAQLFFITGADAYREIHTWHRAEELVNSVNMVVAPRPGYTLEALEAPFEGAQVLNTRLCEVSSTEVRARLAEGRSVRYLVPQIVESYLVKSHLYRGQSLQEG